MIPKDIHKQLIETLPEALVNQSRFIELARQEYLFQPQENVDSIYYVIKGQLRALRYQYDGKPAVMMHSTAGNFFAPVSIHMDCYPCAAMAHKSTQLLKIPKATLLTYLQTHPDFSLQFIGAIAQDLKQQCSNAERLRIKSARDRVIHFITCESADSKTLQLNYPLSTWADELGLEPESLYRTLADMERDGIIERVKKQIKVL